MNFRTTYRLLCVALHAQIMFLIKMEQQELIIQTANNMFHQSGIRNVSIDDICSELRISKKTFYTHFQQKEELVDAVLTYDKSKYLEKFIKSLTGKNAIDALIFIVKEIKKATDCEPQALWYDVQKFYPKVFEKHEKEKSERIKMGFEHNLKQGILEGYYRDDLDVELISLFHTVQMKATFELMEQSPKKYSKRRLLDFFIDLMIHLIANEKGLAYMKTNYLNDEQKQETNI